MRFVGLILVSVVGVAAGCGGDSPSETPDAASIDGDPNSGETGIVVTRGGDLPLPGIQVIFSNPDGTVISHTVTDAYGRALGLLPDGGQITIAYVYPETSPPLSWLVTWTDVDAGAYIRYGFPTFLGTTVVGQANVSLSETLPAASTYEIALFGGADCWDYVTDVSSPTVITINDMCVKDDNVSIVAQARDGSDLPIAFTAPLDVPFEDPLNVTLPAWRTDLTAYDITAANSAADIVTAQITAWTTRHGQLGFGQYLPGGEILTGRSVTSTYLAPAADQHDGIQELIEFFYLNSSGIAVTNARYLRRRPPNTAEGPVDGATLIPAVDAVMLDDPTAERPIVSWSGAPPSHDVVLVQYLSAESPTSSVSHSWNVITSPAHSSVQLPALPAELGSWLPPAGQDRFVYVTRVEANTIGSYSEALAIPISQSYPEFPLLPPDPDVIVVSNTRGGGPL